MEATCGRKVEGERFEDGRNAFFLFRPDRVGAPKQEMTCRFQRPRTFGCGWNRNRRFSPFHR